MVHQATREIASALDSKDLKYDIVENDNTSRVICGMNGKALNFRIQYISTDEDNDVAVRVFDLVKIPEEKKTDMLLFAHECNRRFRYVKFVVNEGDNTLQLEYDMPLKNENPGEIALELLVRILNILNDVGMDMMRRVWA